MSISLCISCCCVCFEMYMHYIHANLGKVFVVCLLIYLCWRFWWCMKWSCCWGSWYSFQTGGSTPTFTPRTRAYALHSVRILMMMGMSMEMETFKLMTIIIIIATITVYYYYRMGIFISGFKWRAKKCAALVCWNEPERKEPSTSSVESLIISWSWSIFKRGRRLPDIPKIFMF